MAQSARNDEQLIKLLKQPFKKVTEYILDKILEANETVAIAEKVYGAGEPEEYNRTGEFAKAWDKQVHTSSNLRHDVEGFMFYNWKSMSVGSDDPDSPNYGQHIGVAGEYQGKDARQYLAEIIYQGISGPAFGHGYWNKKRDAFKRLVNYVGKGRFNTWFREGCKMNGLDIKLVEAVDVEYNK